MRISDWSSDVCSSDLVTQNLHAQALAFRRIDLSAIGGQNKVEPVFDIGVGDDLPVHDRGRLAHARIGRTQYGQLGWQVDRSEERRVGKECVSPCRSRWSP